MRVWRGARPPDAVALGDVWLPPLLVRKLLMAEGEAFSLEMARGRREPCAGPGCERAADIAAAAAAAAAAAGCGRA